MGEKKPTPRRKTAPRPKKTPQPQKKERNLFSAEIVFGSIVRLSADQ